jgi:hypothetical protein
MERTKILLDYRVKQDYSIMAVLHMKTQVLHTLVCSSGNKNRVEISSSNYSLGYNNQQIACLVVSVLLMPYLLYNLEDYLQDNYNKKQHTHYEVHCKDIIC